MKINQIIQTTKEKELSIKEITLISKEEYETAKGVIPPLRNWWWLRSPLTLYGDYSGVVDDDGWVDDTPVDLDNGVRPALRIKNPESIDLKIEDKFILAGYTWIMILPDVALCDSIVGYTQFRKASDAENAILYEQSYIKQWLEDWAKEKGITVKE